MAGKVSCNLFDSALNFVHMTVLMQRHCFIPLCYKISATEQPLPYIRLYSPATFTATDFEQQRSADSFGLVNSLPSEKSLDQSGQRLHCFSFREALQHPDNFIVVALKFTLSVVEHVPFLALESDAGGRGRMRWWRHSWYGVLMRM